MKFTTLLLTAAVFAQSAFAGYAPPPAYGATTTVYKWKTKTETETKKASRQIHEQKILHKKNTN